VNRELVRCVRANDYKGTWDALEAGANPNMVANTTLTSPLHYACKQGNLEIASLLLARGANVNAQTGTGWAGLHFATNSDNEEMVRLLRAYGGRADLINEWLKVRVQCCILFLSDQKSGSH
jgi:ankyrin repeat protein